MQRALFRSLNRYVQYRASRLRQATGCTGLGVGQKVRSGRNYEPYAIVVYVDQKRQDVIPQPVPRKIRVQVAGKTVVVRTDVEEASGIGYLAGLASGSEIRSGRVLPPPYTGTCAFSYILNNKHLLSCAHLFYDPTHQGQADACFAPNGAPIGNVYQWTPLSPTRLNVGDAARVDLLPQVPVDALRITNRPGFLTSASNILPTKSGFVYVVNGISYRCSAPRFRNLSDPVYLEHRGIVLQYANCWLMNCDDSPVMPGHSGALMFVEIVGGVYQPVGLVCGFYSGFAVVFDADEMIRRVGILS